MSTAFDKLVAIMTRLRGEKGCPWDKEQTHETLKPYLIEESYEVIEAIDSGDSRNLKEELGDLLLQVVFHAEIARANGRFSIEDVLKGLTDKLVTRHPHVFGESRAETAEDVLKNWEKRKLIEKGSERESLMDGIPASLPALMRAEKIQKRASKAGFDWPDRNGIIEKFEEEWNEFKSAIKEGVPEAVEEETGDLLFTLVNLARSLRLDSEQTLRKSTEKFIFRYKDMERLAKLSGVGLENLSADELNRLWTEAKRNASSPRKSP